MQPSQTALSVSCNLPMAQCKSHLIVLIPSITLPSISANSTSPHLSNIEKYLSISMALKSISTSICRIKVGRAVSFNSFFPRRIPQPRLRQLVLELRVAVTPCTLLALEVTEPMLQLPKSPGKSPGDSTKTHRAESTGISMEAVGILQDRWSDGKYFLCLGW